MEIDKDLYEWLTSTVKAIEPTRQREDSFMSNKNTNGSSIIQYKVTAKQLEMLSRGKNIVLIFNYIKELYYTLYKIKLSSPDYFINLEGLSESVYAVSPNIKYNNWNLISESFTIFSLTISTEERMKIANNDHLILIEVLYRMFYLSSQLQLKINEEQSNLVRINITSGKYPGFNEDELLFHGDNNLLSSETIDIRSINPVKQYDICSSPLEYLIVSLCKNFDLTPKQSIALLTNNRKYLQILITKGMNGSFFKVEKWIKDLIANNKVLIRLVRTFPNTSEIIFSCIGIGLLCPIDTISLSVSELIIELENQIGMDWSWMLKEGIDSFIYAISQHDKFKLTLMNMLLKLIGSKSYEFLNELKKKTYAKDSKHLLMKFSVNIIPIVNEFEKEFSSQFQAFIFDLCLNERKDESLSLSILSELWFYTGNVSEQIKTDLLEYFTSCIESNKKNVALTAIAHLFIMLERFFNIKSENAPKLLRYISTAFIKYYSYIELREFFLLNIKNFFTTYKTVPIDILMLPYLIHIKRNKHSLTIYDMCFVMDMLEHPRIDYEILSLMLEFLFNVTIHDLIYAKTANVIILMILEKNVINVVCDNMSDKKRIYDKIVEYIKTALTLFISNIEKEEDFYLLQTSYDIMLENVSGVNSAVKDNVVNTVRTYRRVKGCFSEYLVKMMRLYVDNNYILTEIENEYSGKKVIESGNDDVQKKRTIKIDTIVQLDMNNNNNVNVEHTVNNNNANHTANANGNNLFHKKQTHRHNIKPLTTAVSAKDFNNQRYFETDINNNNTILFPPEQLLKTYNKVLYLSLSRKKSYQTQISEECKFDILNPKTKVHNNNIFTSDNKTIIKYSLGTIPSIPQDINFKNVLPIELKEEENFESVAIIAFNEKHHKQISDLFKHYSITPSTKNHPKDILSLKITKGKILEMLITKGITKRELTGDEFNICVHSVISKGRGYTDHNREFSYDEFINILLQIAFVVYVKVNIKYHIYQCYMNLMKRILRNEALIEQEQAYRKRNSKVIQYIQSRINANNYSKLNLPPGYKIENESVIENIYKIPPNIEHILSQSQHQAYTVLNKVCLSSYKRGIFEPYHIKKTISVINLDMRMVNQHNWSNSITLTYITKLNPKYQALNIDVADCLEYNLKKCFSFDINQQPRFLRNIIEKSVEYGEPIKVTNHYLSQKQKEAEEKKQIEKMKEEKRKKRKKYLQRKLKLKEEDDNLNTYMQLHEYEFLKYKLEKALEKEKNEKGGKKNEEELESFKIRKLIEMYEERERQIK